MESFFANCVDLLSALPKHYQKAHGPCHSKLFSNRTNELFEKETLPALLEQSCAVMLPLNASHSRKTTKLPYVAHLECVAFPSRVLLELWL